MLIIFAMPVTPLLPLLLPEADYCLLLLTISAILLPR